MRILRKTLLYILQVYFGVIVTLGMILGTSWEAFKTGFSPFSDSFLDKLAEWKDE
jgi:hypothetical protein